MEPTEDQIGAIVSMVAEIATKALFKKFSNKLILPTKRGVPIRVRSTGAVICDEKLGQYLQSCFGKFWSKLKMRRK